MNEFQDLIPDFLDESREHLADIEDDILIMESAVQKGEPLDPEVINRIFRAIHSIKGGSSFVGFEKIEELSHKMEDLLNFIRNGDIIPTTRTIDILLRAIDKLKNMIENSSSSNDENISEYVKELIVITNEGLGKETQKTVSNTKSTSEVIEGYNFTISEYTVERKLAKGHVYLFNVDTINHIEKQGRTILEFVSELINVGEILDTYINFELIEENSFFISFLYYSIMDEDLVKMSFSSIPESNITKIDSTKLSSLFSKTPKTEDGVEPTKQPIKPSVSEKATPQIHKNVEKTQEVNEFLKNDDDSDISEIIHKTKPAAVIQEVEEDDEYDWEKVKEFVTFYIGKEQYSVPIFLVQEIKEMQPFSCLPNQPDYVIGVVNLRGNLVPIFDLRKKLHVEPKPFDKFTVILIMNIRGKIKGCVVDAISDVVLLEAQDKQSTPLLSRNINTEFVKFIGKDQKSNSFLIVLDVEKILEND